MKTYKFHLASSSGRHPDEEGVAFSTADEAIAEAYKAAVQMAEDISSAGGNTSEYSLRLESPDGVTLTEVLFSEVLEPTIPVAHAVSGLGGESLSVDDTFALLLKRPLGDIVEGTLLDFTEEADRARNASLLDELRTTGAGFTIRKRYYRPDTCPIWVEEHVACFSKGAMADKLIAAVRVLSPREAAWEAVAKLRGLPSFADSETRLSADMQVEARIDLHKRLLRNRAAQST